MNDLFEATRQLHVFCGGQRWRSSFIGGLARQRWGEPRVTPDVDLTVMAGFGGENRIIDPLLAAYPQRIEDAASFVRRHRVLLLRTPIEWVSRSHTAIGIGNPARRGGFMALDACAIIEGITESGLPHAHKSLSSL